MLSRSKVVFAPLCYEERQAHSAFYVDDIEAAKALRVSIRFCKIEGPWSMKLNICHVTLHGGLGDFIEIY